MDENLAKTLKDTQDVFGELLMSRDFVDNFYICFFTLSPNSELKFVDVEKQKKAFVGFVTSILRMLGDPGTSVHKLTNSIQKQ